MGFIYDDMMKESKDLFANSTNVKYWPYIGKGYFRSKEKILVLGDSHYLSNPSLRQKMENYPYWTNEVIIADYLGQGYTQNFSSFADFPKWIPQDKDSYLKGFRNTAKMLSHSEPQCSDYVWENLAFFNFFQKPVAPCPGSHEWLMADYDNYIRQARAAFDEVVKKLSPNIVIVWGKTDLTEKWLPRDKERLYPNVIFFTINHPSYTIKSEYIQKWNSFVKEQSISEQYAQHHPCYKKVEGLFSAMRKQEENIKFFNTWYSERSIGYELYQDWDNAEKRFIRTSPVNGKSNAIVLMVTMDTRGEATLTLSTKQESEAETVKIVSSPSFVAFSHKRSLKCDGIYELCKIDASAKTDALTGAISTALRAIVEYRDGLNVG